MLFMITLSQMRLNIHDANLLLTDTSVADLRITTDDLPDIYVFLKDTLL